jgi:hypothetical protein
MFSKTENMLRKYSKKIQFSHNPKAGFGAVSRRVVNAQSQKAKKEVEEREGCFVEMDCSI